MEDQVERVLTAFGAVNARSAHLEEDSDSQSPHGLVVRTSTGAIEGQNPVDRPTRAEKSEAAGVAGTSYPACPVVRPTRAEETEAPGAQGTSRTTCPVVRLTGAEETEAPGAQGTSCTTCPIVRPIGAEQAELCAVILREKDLSESEYYQMLCKVKTLCNGTGVLLISHNYVDAALSAGVESIHLPMPVLRRTPQDKLRRFSVVGASAHSVLEAKEAADLGATYITASHIFPTDCKKDLPPRGLDFLTEVCGAVTIPVYALGGINFVNAPSCIVAGAAGVCMMSEFMKL